MKENSKKLVTAKNQRDGRGSASIIKVTWVDNTFFWRLNDCVLPLGAGKLGPGVEVRGLGSPRSDKSI